MPITDIDWPQWQKLNSYYNMNTGLLELGIQMFQVFGIQISTVSYFLRILVHFPWVRLKRANLFRQKCRQIRHKCRQIRQKCRQIRQKNKIGKTYCCFFKINC